MKITPVNFENIRESRISNRNIFATIDKLRLEVVWIDLDRRIEYPSKFPNFVLEQINSANQMLESMQKYEEGSDDFSQDDALFCKMAFCYFAVCQFAAIGIDKFALIDYVSNYAGLKFSDKSFKNVMQRLVELGFVKQVNLYRQEDSVKVYSFYVPEYIDHEKVSDFLLDIVNAAAKKRKIKIDINEVRKQRYISTNFIGGCNVYAIKQMALNLKIIHAFMSRNYLVSAENEFKPLNRKLIKPASAKIEIGKGGDSLVLYVSVPREYKNWQEELESGIEELANAKEEESEKTNIFVCLENADMIDEAQKIAEKFKSSCDFIFTNDVDFINDFKLFAFDDEGNEVELLINEEKFESAAKKIQLTKEEQQPQQKASSKEQPSQTQEQKAEAAQTKDEKQVQQQKAKPQNGAKNQPRQQNGQRQNQRPQQPRQNGSANKAPAQNNAQRQNGTNKPHYQNNRKPNQNQNRNRSNPNANAKHRQSEPNKSGE